MGQELTQLSFSGLELVPSSLLSGTVTEEGLTFQTQAVTNSRGTPVVSESMPFGCLLFWSFEESINSLGLVPILLNQKSYLGQIL